MSVWRFKRTFTIGVNDPWLLAQSDRQQQAEDAGAALRAEQVQLYYAEQQRHRGSGGGIDDSDFLKRFA